MLTIIGLLITMLFQTTLQIDPSYIDCANEVNYVIREIKRTTVLIPPESIEYPLPISVTAELSVVELHGIDTEEQTLSITAMLKLKWKDYRLSAVRTGSYFGALCASSNYSEWRYTVEAVNRLPWYPQWVISNGGKGVLLHGAWNYYPARVSGNGDVEWVAMYHLETECVQDIFYFPSDYQRCNITFNWPTTDAHIIELSAPTPAITLHDENSAIASLWTLEGQMRLLGTGHFPSVTFGLLLSRRSSYYICAMMIPTLLLNLMVTCGMIFPPLAPKKAVVAFLNLTTVFLTNMEYYEYLPQTSDDTRAPVALYFFAVHNMLAGAATMFICVVSRIAEFREQAEKKKKSKKAEKPPQEKVGEHNLEDDSKVSEDGSLLGSCLKVKMNLDKLNLVGGIIYVVICLISYIGILGFIYGTSSTKVANLLATSYSRLTIAAK